MTTAQPSPPPPPAPTEAELAAIVERVVSDYQIAGPAGTLHERLWPSYRAAKADVQACLRAIFEMQQIIADMMLDGGVETGRQDQRRAFLAILRERLADEQKWSELPGMDDEGREVCFTAIGVLDAIVRKLEAVGPSRTDPLPPDAVRAENVKLREALRKIADGSFVAVDIAAEALGEPTE